MQKTLCSTLHAHLLSIVVAGGVWAFATVYWFLPGIGGKTFFKGPHIHDTALDLYPGSLPVDGSLHGAASEDASDDMNKNDGR